MSYSIGPAVIPTHLQGSNVQDTISRMCMELQREASSCEPKFKKVRVASINKPEAVLEEKREPVELLSYFLDQIKGTIDNIVDESQADSLAFPIRHGDLIKKQNALIERANNLSVQYQSSRGTIESSMKALEDAVTAVRQPAPDHAVVNALRNLNAALNSPQLTSFLHQGIGNSAYFDMNVSDSSETTRGNSREKENMRYTPGNFSEAQVNTMHMNQCNKARPFSETSEERLQRGSTIFVKEQESSDNIPPVFTGLKKHENAFTTVKPMEVTANNHPGVTVSNHSLIRESEAALTSVSGDSSRAFFSNPLIQSSTETKNAGSAADAASVFSQAFQGVTYSKQDTTSISVNNPAQIEPSASFLFHANNQAGGPNQTLPFSSQMPDFGVISDQANCDTGNLKPTRRYDDRLGKRKRR